MKKIGYSLLGTFDDFSFMVFLLFSFYIFPFFSSLENFFELSSN